LTCYGLAEATVAVTGAREARARTIHASGEGLRRGRIEVSAAGERAAQPLVACGPPIEGVTVRIVDAESKKLCPPDLVGEIWVRGPNVAQGYWNKPEQSGDVFGGMIEGLEEGPFLRTGDLGFIQDGSLFVTGRAKEMIIIRGQNYYPQDLESSAQSSHPSLAPDGAAAFGIDVRAEESLVVVQEVRRTARREIEGVVDAVRARIAADHSILPWAIFLVGYGQLPRTTSGKVQRHACRRMLQNGDFAVLDIWCADREVEPWLTPRRTITQD
jgi:acyl-CoA synthetase (AMP-forming)/AMP-acid ligase II